MSRHRCPRANVTRSYPGLIADDAAMWLRFYRATAKHHYQESEGAIAAWAADEERLGHSKLVNRYLSQQAKAGQLKGDTVNAKKLVSALMKFLAKPGYISAGPGGLTG